MLDRMTVGEVAKKHHIKLLGPDGALRVEECLTRGGFDGPYSILYHLDRPHTASAPRVTQHGWALPRSADPELLAKRHYQSQELAKLEGPTLDARRVLLFNDDVHIGIATPTEADPVWFNNGDADQLFFIFEGAGTLQTPFGDLRFERFDYVCVPKGVIHRFLPDTGVAQTWLTMDCPGGLGLLRQWRNEVGQLTMDAPYSHRDFRRPTFQGPRDEGIRELVVKRGGFTAYTLQHSPLDVVGWDGAVYPWVFPILNFQPRAGLVHLPPTWHGTFQTRGALICSFVPRVVDFHPEAIPCPYPHSSVDCDEFLFYCDGNFTSRKGVGPGSISHHPMGVPHGPHPGSYEKSVGTTRTDELAVMVDTFKPLHRTALAESIEDGDYTGSFL